MIKRFIIAVFAVLICFSYGFVAFANSSMAELVPYGDFAVYERDAEKVSKILGTTKKALEAYVNENGIMYLAVDAENTKQIRLSCSVTDFSSSVVNISLLSNDKIIGLIPDIIGLDNVKGDIVEKNGQKFVKTVLSSTDSGGEYILTQYITVANKKTYVLSFYTDADVSTEYIEKTFETYNLDGFINDSAANKKGLQAIIITATVVFAAISVIVAITIVIDIRKSKNDEE